MSKSANPGAGTSKRQAAASRSLEDLPPYSRSLLRIRLPVSVSLASKKETVGEILQLGPGAIIKFDKACDEMLQLSIGNIPVAEGDAIKVGDKFGLRINRILPPHERFRRAGGK
jgi:flagellar motor switch/type III secretory pathway protein FliN